MDFTGVLLILFHRGKPPPSLLPTAQGHSCWQSSFTNISNTKFRNTAWVFPAEHGKSAWLSLNPVLTHLLHTSLLPDHHTPGPGAAGWACPQGWDGHQGLIWMGMVWIPHLMAGAETEPAQWLQQHLCVQSLLQHQVCTALEAKSEQLAFHHSHKKTTFSSLGTHRQRWPCHIPFGISILRSSQHLCQQMTPPSKVFSEGDCISGGGAVYQGRKLHIHFCLSGAPAHQYKPIWHMDAEDLASSARLCAQHLHL